MLVPPAAVQGAVARWAARLHGQGCPHSSGGRGSTVPRLQGALSSQVLEAGPRLPPAPGPPKPPGPSARDASLPSLPVILTWPLPRAALRSDSSFSSGDVAGPAPAPRCGFTSPGPRVLQPLPQAPGAVRSSDLREETWPESVRDVVLAYICRKGCRSRPASLACPASLVDRPRPRSALASQAGDTSQQTPPNHP